MERLSIRRAWALPLLVTCVAIALLSLLSPRTARAQDVLLGRPQPTAQPDDDDDDQPTQTTSVVPGKKKPGDDAKLPPAHVKVGIYVLNIGKYDLATGGFTVDFYLDLTSVDGQPMGTQSFEFMNGRAAQKTVIIDEPTEKFYRIQANLATNVDLRSFPWDTHELPIVLEDTVRDIDGDDDTRGLVYEFDAVQSGIDTDVHIVGWRLDGYQGIAWEHDYGVPTPPDAKVDVATSPIYNGKEKLDRKAKGTRAVYVSEKTGSMQKYSQLRFQLDIGRLYFIATVKTFLPVTVFLIIVMISLLVGVENMPQRQTMNTAMLIASAMYHINITNSLPPVGYLTRADKVMIATYSTVALNLFLTVFMVRYAAWHDHKEALKKEAEEKRKAEELRLKEEEQKKKDEEKKRKEEEKWKKAVEEAAAAGLPPPEKKEKKDEKKEEKKKEEKKEAKPAKPPPSPILLKWRRRAWIIVPLYAIIAYTIALATKNGN